MQAPACRHGTDSSPHTGSDWSLALAHCWQGNKNAVFLTYLLKCLYPSGQWHVPSLEVSLYQVQLVLPNQSCAACSRKCILAALYIQPPKNFNSLQFTAILFIPSHVYCSCFAVIFQTNQACLQWLLLKELKAFLCNQPDVHRQKRFLLGTKRMCGVCSEMLTTFTTSGLHRVALCVSRLECLDSCDDNISIQRILAGLAGWVHVHIRKEDTRRKIIQILIIQQVNEIPFGVKFFRWQRFFFFAFILPISWPKPNMTHNSENLVSFCSDSIIDIVVVMLFSPIRSLIYSLTDFSDKFSYRSGSGKSLYTDLKSSADFYYCCSCTKNSTGDGILISSSWVHWAWCSQIPCLFYGCHRQPGFSQSRRLSGYQSDVQCFHPDLCVLSSSCHLTRYPRQRPCRSGEGHSHSQEAEKSFRDNSQII